MDFKKKLKEQKIEKKISPIDIYETLDRKSITGPLRPAQLDILKKWFNEKKETRDLIVKLHTGQGKTLLGLLMLQSLLNSKEGPCTYVCANKYLVEQVCGEAEKFGISYCTLKESNEIPEEYLSGEKLLITHAHKVFNGRSVFSKKNQSEFIGTILLDDSHACIDIIKDAFTVTITKKMAEDEIVYNKIFELFQNDLKEQGEGSLLDVKSGDGNIIMPIPYWSWEDKKSEVLEILADHKENNQIKFTWNLIKNSIENYSCYISGEKLEISPDYPDIDEFPIFSKSPKRILMSATTQDDSFCAKALDFDIHAIKEPLVYNEQKWSGEKMILAPSLISDNLDRNLIVTTFSRIKYTKFGCVSIVPSTYLSNQYKNLGAIVTNSSNIFNEIDTLKSKKFENLLVINNRYDGIDLPDESCRILIIDSMPYFDSLADRFEEKARPTSEVINKKVAQKIEQGLGRGVRGEKDYCAIMLIGSDLIRFVKSRKSEKYFSNQTRKQLEIGLGISSMAKDEIGDEASISDVIDLIKQSINRDEGWKEYYSNKMEEIETPSIFSDLYERLEKEKEIEKNYINGEYQKACYQLQTYIDELKDDENEKAWYRQKLAKFYYYIDKVKSKKIQIAAFKKNRELLKPKDGITYNKLSFIDSNKTSNIRKYVSKFKDHEELRINVNEILDNLTFGVASDKFENALEELGKLLGFISERPDKNIRKGPDNLWCGTNNKFLMFECKNKVDLKREEISKSEVGQMNSHCGWFDDTYGKNKNVNHFIIIPTKIIAYEGHFTHDVKIITPKKLKLLKSNVRAFINGLHSYKLTEIEDDILEEQLTENALDLESSIDNYYEEPILNR
ncbi:helicase C-terminal domain-containing protein [Staphylococcus hominis]|uniref:DEAD/DEAH box helicase family protein n=1 Tax=Staphylococcus hominis TaxID=1290 RepID=UPI0034CD7752